MNNHNEFYARIIAAFREKHQKANAIIPYTEDRIELQIEFNVRGYVSVETYRFTTDFNFEARTLEWRKTSSRLGESVVELIKDKIDELKEVNRRVRISGSRGSMPFLLDTAADYL